MWVNDTPMLIDAGVGTYTRQTFSSERYTIWTMQSNYHNLPLVNGVPQKYGRKYKAKVLDAANGRFSVDIAEPIRQKRKSRNGSVLIRLRATAWTSTTNSN